MFTLKSEHSFDSAHFLSGYEGKCSNIHGHRWRVVVEVFSETLDDKNKQTKGMVVDFHTLKDDIVRELDYYDHSFIIENNTMKESTLKALEDENIKIVKVDFRTTAENFSKHFFELFEKLGYNVKSVSVYETPNNCATYYK